MKYVVSGGATLSLPDGSKFELAQGIIDSDTLPKAVTGHWAFSAYAKPLDENDVKKEKAAKDLAAQVKALQSSVDDLKAQLDKAASESADKDKTIDDLKAQLDALTATTEPVDTKNAKKQQASD